MNPAILRRPPRNPQKGPSSDIHLESGIGQTLTSNRKYLVVCQRDQTKRLLSVLPLETQTDVTSVLIPTHTSNMMCYPGTQSVWKKKCYKTWISSTILKGQGGVWGESSSREIVANAGNSCCGPFGSGLLWFCRNQSWFPSYLSRSGFYQLHSSHHCFLPQRQSCLCLVQRATPSPALAAPCVGTDPRSSCHLQQAVLAGFLALHLQPAVVISFFTSPLRWERFGRRILWDTAEPQVQLCHGGEQAHCSSQQNWAGGLRLPQSFISSGFLCLRR